MAWVPILNIVLTVVFFAMFPVIFPLFLMPQTGLSSLKGYTMGFFYLAAWGPLYVILHMICMTRATSAATGVAGWLYPVLVFAGFGVIDILFKRVALAGIPLGDSLQAMFALALLVAFAMQLWRRLRDRVRLTSRSALAGVALGMANFGNILFYLRGHRALPAHPALVFASMNIGVVALGAVVGLLLFRERLSRLNLGGVLLAVAAIAVIAWP